MFSRSLAALAALSSLAVPALAALPSISATGNKLFDTNGKQFFIKGTPTDISVTSGIAYQLTPDDPLIDTDQCTRDAELMKTLGANTIRVYHVDPTGDHDGCMSALDKNGIYLLLDLDTFDTAISPADTHWDQSQYDAFAAVMDGFAKYDNTLGFFIGNEVIAMNNQSLSAPFVKAAARDMKAYRNSKGYRNIPIGYAAADIAELRPMLQNYLACGGNASETIDFFGLNAYEWCGNVNFQTSGYENLNTYAQAYNLPIFFSETGCNTQPPRTFDDQAAIFGPDMVDWWSGAIVYEWIEEANNYGLISYGPPVDATVVASGVDGGFTRRGTPTPVAPDFTNLQSQWATLTPTGVAKSDYTPSISTPACPSSTPGGWLVNGNVGLPTLGQTGGAATVTLASASVTAAATDPTGSTGTTTGSAATATTSKKSSASGGKQLVGMTAALVSVMLVFVCWL
ncbi:Glucanosyltransferase-domain-containing protein [Xylogone sp. PMI_703]|nr:Glucanosyltransferase-domain-containing protein [Xylogone sp. PMI_703]